MSKELESVRKKIDDLDDQIHDLLMQRADLVSAVIAEKKKHGLPIVHPAREARMIKRLLSRHKGPLPEAAVIRIWRELVGAISMLQDGLKVVIADPRQDNYFWDMSRNYFGSIIPMQRAPNAANALTAVRDNEASFAVLPWPENDEESAWWPHLLHQDTQRTIRIVCCIPYGFDARTNIDTSDKALVVSKTEFRDSEEDNSFIGIELDNPEITRTRIETVLTQAGFDPVSIQGRKINDYDQKIFFLSEVKGYAGPDDKRIKKVENALKGSHPHCISLGGYPIVPEFNSALDAIDKKSDSLKKTGS